MSNRHISHLYQLSAMLTSHVMKMDDTCMRKQLCGYLKEGGQRLGSSWASVVPSIQCGQQRTLDKPGLHTTPEAQSQASAWARAAPKAF